MSWINLMKENKLRLFISVIIAFLALGLSFYTELFFLETSRTDFGAMQWKVYVSSKFLYFTFVFLSVFYGWRFIQGIKNRESFYLKWRNYFLIFFIPYFLFLLASWPGLFLYDDCVIYDAAVNMRLFEWLSYLTSFCYLMGLYLFPSAGSITFLGAVLFLLIASWITSHLDEGGARKPLLILSILIVFFPGVLFYSSVTIARTTFNASLELLLLSLLYFLAKKRTPLTAAKLVLIALLTALLSTWRKEGIYHLILVPLIFFIFFRKTISTKRSLIFLLSLGLSFLFVNNFFTSFIDRGWRSGVGLHYQLSAYLNALPMILVDDQSAISEENLKKISEVIDVEKMKSLQKDLPPHLKAPFESFVGQAGKTVYKFPFNEQKLKNFRKAYWSLVFSNIDIFLAARLRTFIHSSKNASIGDYALYYLVTLNEKEREKIDIKNNLEPFLKNKLNHPISMQVKKKTFGLVESSQKYAYVFYNFILLTLILFCVMIRSFSWKDPLGYLILILLIRFFIVFITAPAAYNYYYYPIVPSGFFLLLFAVIEWTERRKLKKGVQSE